MGERFLRRVPEPGKLGLWLSICSGEVRILTTILERLFAGLVLLDYVNHGPLDGIV